jgi:hypothetical protein
MILFLLVGYIYEVYGTRCSTLLHCSGLISAMLLIGLQMNSGTLPTIHLESVAVVPASPAAAQQLLGMLVVHPCIDLSTIIPSSCSAAAGDVQSMHPGSRPGTPYPGSRAVDGRSHGRPISRIQGPSQALGARAQGPGPGPWLAGEALLRVNIGYLGPPRGLGPGPRGPF